MSTTRPRLLILYGSQTGCAADVAERIRRAAKLEEKLAVFIVSTTGQGEEPDNMKKFWRFLLRKDLPKNVLSQLEYSVFGLGDSSYEKFNYPAKKLHKRLQQLGAQPFHARGDGDDQHYLGLDGALDPWLEAVWDTLASRFPLSVELREMDDSVLYPLVFVDEDASSTGTIVPQHAGDHLARLTRNQRVTPKSHFQDVRLVELEFDQLPAYQPGDIIDIMPENCSKDVETFLEHIGLLEQADRLIRIDSPDPNYPLPSRISAILTLRDLCRCWLDIFSVPRRSFFELTAHFAEDPEHAEKLHYFSTAAGQDDLYAYCYRMRRTAFEVLQDFNSIKLPLDYLLEIFPILRPRSFSIASSSKVHDNTIQLLIGIVKYRTRMATPRTGVFTRWLADLPPIDINDNEESTRTLSVWIRRGTLRLPSSDGPIILIAPGLGLAPMRALLEERLALQQHSNILIFGCRHQQADFYFSDEWRVMCEKGALQLFTAFSRDQNEKQYVQHVIMKQAALIWTAIQHQHGSIYVCGKSKRMPEDVIDAFCDVFVKQGNLSEQEARELIVTLKRTGRYQQECWD
ncbi:hypothetical protein BDF22DRAFT_746813 [Syncephalis plumigaleata]|nr:hypothetical protein BDF22DRAFT_746813 [Syncephalis plumigaleata]